ncbi:MAG: flagellar brake protein [Azonexus sp.]
MSQLAQLSEAEIEERFHITGRTAIQFMLAGFVRSRDAFSVQFGGAHDLFLSTMLAVEPERLIFDCSGSPETNQLFLKSRRNVFVGRPGGIQVHFSTGAASEIDFEGGKAFAVELPKVLMRLQRRDNFRIETPRVRPLEFFARLPDGGLLSLPVHDISVCGIGLTATASPPGLAPGSLLANCHFSLPEETSDLFFSATLRHLSELEGRAGQRQWRLGLQFNDLPANDAKRIQRYIIRIEHERHELA